MCYFVEQNIPRKELEKRFGLPMPEDPRYVPGYFHSAFAKPYLPVITSDDPGIIRVYQWGLIPSWVRDSETAEKIRNSTINARSETVWEKPSFRSAIKSRRCLVIAHGFFEYHTDGNKKIPYYIKMKNDSVFSFAGLFESWTNPQTGEIRNTFSILTTEANPLLEKIHNLKKRMPVILSESNHKQWLQKNIEKSAIDSLLIPYPENEMNAYTVSGKIARRDADISDPSLIEFYNYDK